MKRAYSDKLIFSYAGALFSLSERDLEATRKEVEFLLDFFKNQEGIFAYLSHPLVAISDKREVLLSVDNTLSTSLVKFIVVIFINRRSNLLVLILKKFLDLVKKKRDELEIMIKSAEALRATDIEIIIKSLSFLGKITKVTNKVDSSIIGGFVVRYGFNLIDASIKTYLNRLVDLSREEILKMGDFI